MGQRRPISTQLPVNLKKMEPTISSYRVPDTSGHIACTPSIILNNHHCLFSQVEKKEKKLGFGEFQ